jgi:hypothetical protein
MEVNVSVSGSVHFSPGKITPILTDKTATWGPRRPEYDGAEKNPPDRH